MIPQANVSQPDQLLADLRNTLNKIISNQKTNEERQKQSDITAMIAEKKQEQILLTETKNLRAELSRKQNELQEVKRQLDEKEHEISFNYKKEFRHLSDTLVEKQAEIQYLNKHVFTLKNRVTSLEQDLNQSNFSRKALEQSLTKTVELIKSQFKQLFDSKQDQELNRFMSETNLKQINDKLEAVLNVCVDLEKKKSFLEEKYHMVKKQNTQHIQNNIKLQVELEKLKEQLWQEKQINQSYNQNKQFALEEVQFFAKKSKSSRLSHGPSQMNSQENKNRSPKSQPSYQQSMEQTINLLKAETNMLLNMEQRLVSLNKKIDHDTDIWRQVLTVKQANAALQLQINELKSKINPEHQDQLLKQKHPTLYKFFSQKMSEILKFQKRLQDLENDAHRIVSTLDNMLYNGVPQKQLKPDENQILERENAVKSKVKREMLQAFEVQKQTLSKDAQKHHQTEIQTLKQKIAELNHEISRLQDKNQNLFILLEESQKVNKRKSSPIEEKLQKIEICETVVNNGQAKVETQSVVGGLDPSQISHLNFLEEKVQRLEEQLKESHKKIETYKKEIRHMLETYKLKSTKNKYSRCNECLLRIDDIEDYDTKCPKCKTDIHDGECAKTHEKNCKKNTVNMANTTANKAKPKKPEPKVPAFSQRLDYF